MLVPKWSSLADAIWVTLTLSKRAIRLGQGQVSRQASGTHSTSSQENNPGRTANACGVPLPPHRHRPRPWEAQRGRQRAHRLRLPPLWTGATVSKVSQGSFCFPTWLERQTFPEKPVYPALHTTQETAETRSQPWSCLQGTHKWRHLANYVMQHIKEHENESINPTRVTAVRGPAWEARATPSKHTHLRKKAWASTASNPTEQATHRSRPSGSQECLPRAASSGRSWTPSETNKGLYVPPFLLTTESHHCHPGETRRTGRGVLLQRKEANVQESE